MAGAPLRIALFSNTLPPLDARGEVETGRPYGGVEMAAWSLAHALARAGHTVDLHGAAPARRTLDRSVGRGSLTIHLHQARFSVGQALAAPAMFRAPLKGPRPDVVLALMGDQPGPWAALRCARRWKVPLVVGYHGDWVGGFGSPLRRLGVWYQTRRLAPRILSAAAAVVALSAESAAASPLLAPHAGKLHVIPNGIDAEALRPVQGRAALRQTLGIPAGAPVALFLGALNPIKGVDVLLDAWAEVGRSLPDAHLVVLGDGPYRAAYERQAKESRSPGPGRVHFRGFVHVGKGDFYAAADALVLPSRSETFPMVILEAGAAGLPVVASDLPPLRAMVQDGANGLLVPPEDSAALAAALLRLLRDPRLRARLGEANHARSEGLGWDRIAERTAALLREAVG
ncbi:MAG TPA: glycosyltransferase family 4 protein [Candidatus Thermoplasmatota archaeon]|nr:glycosyltransferase family 4 protein [Candidatus Thermoplasmatota archaeon]